MYTLASHSGIASEAIHRFADEVAQSTALADRLGYARAWYAERNKSGRWRFAPSKWAGYEDLDAKKYINLTGIGLLDGRKTEACLQAWYREVDPSTELYDQLSSKLSRFLARYGKAPSRKMRINVRNEVHLDYFGVERSGDIPLLDLIVAVAESLPPSQVKALRKRLKALGG